MRRSILLFMLLLVLKLPAQTSVVDSLQQVLAASKEDTARINVLHLLARKLMSRASDKAEEYGNQELALAQKLHIESAVAQSLNDLGGVYYMTGRFPQSIKNNEQALAIYEKLHDSKMISRVNSNIGLAYEQQGAYSKALEYYFRSLKAAEDLKNDDIIAATCGNIGNVFLNQKNFEKALQYQRRSLELRTKHNQKQGMCYANAGLGNIYFNQKNYDTALVYYTRSKQIAEETGDLQMIAQGLNNIGGVWFLKGDRQKGMQNIQQSIGIKEKIGDKPGVANGLYNIADALYEEKDYSASLDYALKSLAMAEELHLLEKQENVHNLLSNLYEKLGKHDKALEHYKAFIASRDSLFSEENTRKSVEAEMNFEYEKKAQAAKLEQEKKDAIAAKEAQQQRTIRNFLLGGLGMVMLMAVIAYRGYRQKRKANILLEEKNALIEEQHKEIRDSINYAKRIQLAILPSRESISNAFPDCFIFYRPKDVVSGDFYSFTEKDGKYIIAAVDCTGHGVPGAFMSMIGNDQLNHIIIERGITTPSEILNQLNRNVKAALKQDATNATIETRDGMDIALCTIDPSDHRLEFAGAHRPLYYFGSEYSELQPDKHAIGGTTSDAHRFTNHELRYSKGDVIYIFSDGYIDQFGGEQGKKFMKKRFRELLESIRQKPMHEQENILSETFGSWKGNREQIDDVLVIGIRF